MTSEKNHIGSNFDDFLKEENIEISEYEIRKILESYQKLYSQSIGDVGDLPSKILAKDNKGDWIEI